MADFTIKDFENVNNFSNRNIESVVSEIVNESSNAVFINMFEDSVILLDHEEGQFYTAKYNFDVENLTVTFEEFDQVNIYKEEDDLQEKAEAYFDEDSEVSIEDVLESFKNTHIVQDKYIKELTNEALMVKDINGTIDWRELRGILENVSLDIKGEQFYKDYKKRIESNPLTEIKIFDWDNPVKVSIIETEEKKIINSDTIESASNLWREEEFREGFEENCKIMIEDVEDGMENFAEFFTKYPQVFLLEDAERQTMFGKAIVYSDSLRENSSDLLKGLKAAFDKYDVSEIKEEYLNEEGTVSSGEGDGNNAPEVSKSNQKKIVSNLKKIAVDVENPNLKRKLESVIESLEGAMTEGTDPVLMKEIVSMLEV